MQLAQFIGMPYNGSCVDSVVADELAIRKEQLSSTDLALFKMSDSVFSLACKSFMDLRISTIFWFITDHNWLTKLEDEVLTSLTTPTCLFLSVKEGITES